LILQLLIARIKAVLVAYSSLFLYFLEKLEIKESSLETDIIIIREPAIYLKMAEKTLCRLAADGIIPGFKVGGA